MPLDPTHPIPPNKVHVHAKAGGEGAAIFDSSIALLQGMFPPTPLNKITIANGTTVVSPLGGYQYVPVEMVPDSSDSVLESWVDCSVGSRPLIARVRPVLNGGRSYRASRSTLRRSTTRKSSSQWRKRRRTFSVLSVITCLGVPLHWRIWQVLFAHLLGLPLTSCLVERQLDGCT